MKKLLHINASPRAGKSRTLKVSSIFLENFTQKHPDWVVDELNLFKEELPPLTLKRLDGKYILLEGKDLFGEAKDLWKEILVHIDRFKNSDMYLISTPMWNYNVPYVLNHYIDLIVQPKYLFKYTEQGPEGLIKNKKMVVVTSRGGDYQAKDYRDLDYQEPYLRTIFGLVGFKDIVFINAQPTDIAGPEVCAQKIKEAQEKAKDLALNI